jgi:hypothetical protein
VCTGRKGRGDASSDRTRSCAFVVSSAADASAAMIASVNIRLIFPSCLRSDLNDLQNAQ